MEDGMEEEGERDPERWAAEGVWALVSEVTTEDSVW